MAEDRTSARHNAVAFNRTVQHDAKRLAILSQAAPVQLQGSRATTLKDIAENPA
jgi:hypothetical protein